MKLSAKCFKGIFNAFMPNQAAWISRTVMVKNNDVESALRTVNGIMANEGMFQRWMLTRRYEKPTNARRRINYERCKAVYNEDMENRIRFFMRKNRKNPYPAC